MKSAAPIPRDRVREAAGELAAVVVTAPIRLGDVVHEDLLGTGIAVVATRDMVAVEPLPSSG